MKASSPLTEGIISFASRLRDKGFIISMSEVGDAVFLLSSIDIMDRQAVKDCLCSLFASGERETNIYNREFDEFFVGEAVIIERSQQQIEAENQRLKRIDFAKEELREYELPEEIAEAYSQVDEKKRQWLKDMVSRVNESPRHLPLAEDYVKRIATGWLAGDGATGLEGQEEDENDLLHKSLVSITEEEAPRALMLIESLVRRINGAQERKYRRSGRDGVPDLRATIHKSMSTGGVPLQLSYKKRRRASKRFVILCDVSESMYRFSGFALRFIEALGGTTNKTEAFIFSEGILKADLADLQNFEKNVKGSSIWRKGTDFGSALKSLLDACSLSQQTVLIILSDGKTVNLPLALSCLEDASRLSRSVLWLNPEKQLGSAGEALSEHCTMLRCATLQDLADACARGMA